MHCRGSDAAQRKATDWFSTSDQLWVLCLCPAERLLLLLEEEMCLFWIQASEVSPYWQFETQPSDGDQKRLSNREQFSVGSTLAVCKYKNKQKTQSELYYAVRTASVTLNTRDKYSKGHTSRLYFHFPAVPVNGLTDEPCWWLKRSFLLSGIVSQCSAADDCCSPVWHLRQLWRWLQLTLVSEWCWFKRRKNMNLQFAKHKSDTAQSKY